MLVLAREVGERVIVTIGGERLEIAILEVRYGRVKIGFTADRSVRVDREEIFARIVAGEEKPAPLRA